MGRRRALRCGRTTLQRPLRTRGRFAIVFDEGRDQGRCDGTLGALSGESCVYLDEIRVGPHVWTSASDNGNGETIESSPTGEDFVAALLGEDLAAALSPPLDR